MKRQLLLFFLFFTLTVALASFGTPADALSIGTSVTSVGAGYKFLDVDDPQFVYAQSYDDNGTTKYRIRLVALSADGTPSSDTVVVTNIPKSVSTLCIAPNGKIYFGLSDGTIWVRTATSTNPLDFEALKTDSNYFMQVGSGYSTPFGMTPIGNRIYFFVSPGSRSSSSDTVDHIYYIDLSSYSTIVHFKDIGTGNYGNMVGLAANDKAVYTTVSYRQEYSDSLKLYVYAHNGTLLQSFSYASTDNGWSGKGWLLLSNDTLYSVLSSYGGGASYRIPLNPDGTLNWDAKKSDSFQYTDLQKAREIYNTELAVYLYGGHANTFIMSSTFIPDPQPPSEEPEASPTPPPEEPEEPEETPYVVELSAKEAYPGQTLMIYVKEEGWLWDSYVEGASVYVDGEYVGKTAYRSWYGKFFGFIGLDKPYVPVKVGFEGEHTVYAIYVKGKSNTATFTVLGSSDLGGTPDGTYPRAPSGDENTVYELRADKTTVYLTSSTGEEVTFRVYKLVSGEERGTVEARIYVNGEPVGKTSRSLFTGEYQFTYRFTEPGIHRVFAEIGDARTGELWITVLDRISEIEPSDGGTISLTVRVTDEDGKPLSGILVQRLENGALKEQRITSLDGTAVLHPVSGVSYTILAADPSGKHLPISYDGSWSSDDALSLTMKSSGAEVRAIHVTVDGSGDGAEILIGKHAIYVRDEYGRALAGATVYVDGEPIGRTSKPLWAFFAEPCVEYAFNYGNHTVMVVYEGKTDVISVSVVDDPNAVMRLAWKLHTGISKLFNLGFFSEYQFTREIRVQRGLFGPPVIELSIIDGSGKKIGGKIYIDGELFAELSEGESCYFQPTGEHTINATAYGVEVDNSPVTVEAAEGTGGTTLFENLNLPPLTGISFLDSILWLVLLIAAVVVALRLIIAILG